MCLSVCLSVCTVTDFSAAEKDRSVKFRMQVRLLSTMSFSHFGEHWLAGSHGGGITSGMNSPADLVRRSMAWAFEIGAAALLKAVWWDLHLASLLTHLFVCLVWFVSL